MSKKQSESFRTIKGTFDILPDASSSDGNAIAATAAWRSVEATIRRVFESYGVREVRTPILEPTGLIARGVGQLTDIVSKEMFAFERGDTQYVLRPEVTAPVMRAYLQHHLDQQRAVQKLYYMGPCFRAERPQKGRYRQFHQFGIEYIGSDAVRADVEVIALMVDVYAAVGISNCRLRLNTLGDAEARQAFREALRSFLVPHESSLSETSRRRLAENPLRILDTKNPIEQELLVRAPRLLDFVSQESRARFDRLQEFLELLAIQYDLDPFLVRGLDYYTETAFELESDALGGSQNALAGGGRYDLLGVEIGSKAPVPAVGFAAGMERLFLAMQELGIKMPSDSGPDLFLALVDDGSARWATGVAREIRQAGYVCEIDLSGRSVKSQMREANRLDAKYVVVVGENELTTGEGRARRMSDGAEFDVRLNAAGLLSILQAGAVTELES